MLKTSLPRKVNINALVTELQGTHCEFHHLQSPRAGYYHCLAIPRKDLTTKKTNPNVKNDQKALKPF